MGKAKTKTKTKTKKVSNSDEKRGTKRSRPVAEEVEEEEENVLATDSRFSEATWDPKFSRIPKKAKGIIEDDRFTSKLKSSQSFRDAEAPVDRFGRPKKRRTEELHPSINHLGTNEDDDDEDEEADIGVEDNEEYEDDSDDDSDADDIADEGEEEEAEDIPRGKATKRLAVMGLDWSVTRSVDIMASLGSFCPTGKQIKRVDVHPSKFGLERLAVEAKLGPQVIPKEDLKVLYNQRTHSVKHSKGRDEEDDDDDDDDDSDNDNEGESRKRNNPKDSDEDDEDEDDEDDDDDEFTNDDQAVWKQQQALRKYEEERLKYYYAVVEFEDVQSADAVYEQCDGVEYSQSGRCFDLRFIPSEMKIETKPRDWCSRVPDSYRPPVVNLSSLNNSTVKLSWDADPPDRMILKKKAFGKNELNEADLKAYLASDSESDAGENEDKDKDKEIEKKRSLLLGLSDKRDGKKNGDGESEDEDDVDLEVTFEPGMLDKGEEILKKKEEKNQREKETEWEARLRRLREKKSEKRKQRKATLSSKNDDQSSGSSDLDDDDDDDGDMIVGENDDNDDDNENEAKDKSFSDPFFSSGRTLEEEERMAAAKAKDKAKKKKERKQSERAQQEDEDQELNEQNKAELELLMMEDKRLESGKSKIREKLAAMDSDEEEEARRNRRKGKSRGKRRWQKEDKQSEQPSAAVVDVNDDRFKNVFDSHLFAIDPTHPKYKQNETTKVLVQEKGKRDRKKEKEGSGSLYDSGRKNDGDSKKSGSEGNAAQAEIQQLAARIKARAKAKTKSKKPAKQRATS